jgi:hypothetical protein
MDEVEIKKLLKEVHRFNNPHLYYEPLTKKKIIKEPEVILDPETPRDYAPNTNLDD